MKSILFHHVLTRLGALFVTIALVYLTAWWCPLIVMTGLLLMRGWYEQIIVGLLLDVLFVSFGTSTSILGPFTAGSCLIALCVWYLRTHVRSVAY